MITLADQLRVHVETLASAPRLPQTKEHEMARAYIRDHLQQAGFIVEEMTDKLDDYACINLMTRTVPDDDRLPLLIIGAHYDTVPGSPGADDNASAVAALLELARWIGPRLQQEKRQARLQLAAYDLEEYGLAGSSLHCDLLKKAGTVVRGMISLEMLGYADSRPGSQQLPPMVAHLYPDTGNFIGVVGNEDSQALLQPAASAMKTVDGLPVEYIVVPGKGEALPVTRRSDHSSFWDCDYPALMITDTAFLRNPHYHQPSDTPQTLDYDFLASVTQGVCAAAWELLA